MLCCGLLTAHEFILLNELVVFDFGGSDVHMYNAEDCVHISAMHLRNRPWTLYCYL